MQSRILASTEHRLAFRERRLHAIQLVRLHVRERLSALRLRSAMNSHGVVTHMTAVYLNPAPKGMGFTRFAENSSYKITALSSKPLLKMLRLRTWMSGATKILGGLSQVIRDANALMANPAVGTVVATVFA